MHTGALVNAEQAQPCSAHTLGGVLPRGRNQEVKGRLQPSPLGPPFHRPQRVAFENGVGCLLFFQTTAGRDRWVTAERVTAQSPCSGLLAHKASLFWSVSEEMGQPRLGHSWPCRASSWRRVDGGAGRSCVFVLAWGRTPWQGSPGFPAYLDNC